MKITETCRCSASLTVEDDDTAAVLATQKDWVGRHQCDGTNPHWVDRTGSTSGTFGFSYQRAVWDPHRATAGPTHLFGGIA